MVVLAIIALIAGLAGPRLIDSFGRAKSRAAQVQLSNLKSALQLFYIDEGRFPTEAEGILALVTAPSGLDSWKGPYVENAEVLNDPWGRPFIYRAPGQNGPFDLQSYGRDGVAGGNSEDADISL
ncbi:type II secretion system protein GspG [Gemmobacter tilapiae]|uniref:Type II secretion system protein GspG n=2 Tax=Neogemmobacter tilapiae TaxID=875041 RepID=A0A918TWY7_9RHOB|nr:type II secretion system protein GspG [Gemmobacter tilapiae]